MRHHLSVENTERTKNNLPQNIYQTNDFALHIFSTTNDLPLKRSPKFCGQFLVISQIGNDVTSKYLITDSITTFYVSRSKLFDEISQETSISAFRDYDRTDYSLYSS